MRGRRPAGPAYVDQLTGSARAKERLKVVLATLAGTCRVQEACQQLGLSTARFHELRREILEAGLARLEPRPAGRPAQGVSPEQAQLAQLQAALAAKDVEARAAQARAAIAVVLPRVAPAATAPEKKTRRRRRTGRRRPQAARRPWRQRRRSRPRAAPARRCRSLRPPGRRKRS
jgi:hypothetical protein